jgi:hypothetical protein
MTHALICVRRHALQQWHSAKCCGSVLPLLEKAKEIVTEWTRQQLYRWLGEDALRIRVEPGLTAASGQDCQVLFWGALMSSTTGC